MTRQEIRLENVRVHYRGSARPALEGADLSIEGPGLVALTGPNGGGKTTLLRLLSGLLTVYYDAIVEGRVSVDGVDPTRDPESLIGRVALLQQDPKTQVVAPTVYMEAALYHILRGAPQREAGRRAAAVLERLGIEGLAERHVTTLSSGELEKTALAGVLSMEPRILLLDEPFSYLDTRSQEIVSEIIAGIAGDNGILVLAATHNPLLVGASREAYTVDKTIRPGAYEGPREPPRRSPRRSGLGEVIVSLEDIVLKYKSRPQPILREGRLYARRGELIVLWGSNGSGKTSLLLAIAGGGGVRCECKRMLLEKPVLVPADPLLLFPRGRLGDAVSLERLPGWARELADKPLLTLSGGQLRLASLALAVSSGRSLLLVDEPTNGLDPWNRLRILELLERLVGEGYTIVAAGHDPWLRGLADRVYCVGGGRVWEC